VELLQELSLLVVVAVVAVEQPAHNMSYIIFTDCDFTAVHCFG
jgi:hypothetical protein